MDFEKIRNTTKCDCGREFLTTDLEKLQRIDDKNFYSGVVKHYSKAKCPDCGKEVILLLKQHGQTYDVLNTAEIKKENSEINETTSENNTTDLESNEIICPECRRTFKNKSGLANHMKTHQNN